MSRSNIFALIEVSKLSESLTTDVSSAKKHLKSQVSYFEIINTKYFSEALRSEWETIKNYMTHKGPVIDETGRLKSNALVNTVNSLSEIECVLVAVKVKELNDKLKEEFK